jgi:hypothetical protein
LAVLARGLRWRGESSVVLLLVSVAAVTAAAVGPIYLAAATESVLISTLAASQPFETGITIAPLSGGHPGPAVLTSALTNAPKGPSGTPLFGAPIYTNDVGVIAGRFAADVIYRTGVCGHLDLTAGSCPSTASSVAVTDRSATALGVRVGRKVVLSVTTISHKTFELPLSVVGIFKPPDTAASYWWGNDYFQYGAGTTRRPLLDDFVVSGTAFAKDAALAGAYTTADLPANTAAIVAAGVGPAGGAVSSFQALLASPSYGLGAGTSLLALLARAGSAQHLMTTVTTVIVLELVLLALCVLFATVARTSESRESEIIVARLRGFPLSSILSVAIAEPAVVMALSLPAGLAIAWVTVSAVAPSLFASGTGVGIGGLAIAAAVAACVGGIIAIALGSVRAARAGQGALSSQAISHSTARRQGVLDIAAITLALAALIELGVTGVLAGNRSDPVAAFAPGLIALGLAVVGVRLVPLLCRMAMRPTRNSKRVASFLAVRQVARRPFLLRQIVLVAVAFSLICFAAAGWEVAKNNRATVANFSVGAATVLTVSVPSGTDFISDVRRADPSGREAMAVATYHGSTGTLFSVDAPRFAAVASWPPGLSPASAAQVASTLNPPSNPPIYVRGTALRATVDLTTPAPTPVALEANVFDETYQAMSIVDIGILRPGLHTYTVSIPGDCNPLCRLVSLTPAWVPDARHPSIGAAGVALVLEALDARVGGQWTAVTGATDPAEWSAPRAVSISRAARGIAFTLGEGAYRNAFDDVEPVLSVADTPPSIPVVFTEDLAQPANGTTTQIEGLDGNSINVINRLNVPLLPGIGTGGAMVDLSSVINSITSRAFGVSYQVWLAAGAPDSVLNSLRAGGIVVLSTRSAAVVATQLSHEGIALAYDLFIFAAIAAGVLAAASTLFAIRVAARRRSNELAALEAMGVARRTLMRSVLAESGIVLLAGIVLGIVGGVVAVDLALPSVPELPSTVGVPPLQYGTPAATLALVVAAAVFVLALCVIVAGIATMRGVRPDRLRMEAT